MKALVEIKGRESHFNEHSLEHESGTAECARTRVRAYFQSLRDQLCAQEVAALTVVDTHVRERVCSIRQQEEDIATVLSQVHLYLSSVDTSFILYNSGNNIEHIS